MECSKCKKQLDINNAVCRCIDCQQYFCDEEGSILEGTSERINFNFLCYDCNDKIFKKRDREVERKERVRRQSERITKEQEKKERNEMLTKQLLHASFSADDDAYNLYDDEKIEMLDFDAFKGGERWEMNFQGKKMSCSGYVELYGGKGPPFDTPIYLTFSYGKISIEKDERGNYYEKQVEVEKNYCLRCANKINKSWCKGGLKKINDSFEKREREKEIQKYYH